MFRGNHQHSVDDKGRVAIPARFREALSGLQDERLVVTKYKRRGRRCLDVYPLSTWLRFEEKITEKRRFNRKLAAFESYYVSGAQDVQIDGQGRLLIPPLLREYAGLGREVVLTGLIDRFQIWNREVWDQVEREDEQEVFDDPQLLDELEL
jgi:transcriptional regulator MraZ